MFTGQSEQLVMCWWHNHGSYYFVDNKWFIEYKEQGIGPWFSIPNKELMYTEERGGGKKMSHSYPQVF